MRRHAGPVAAALLALILAVIAFRLITAVHDGEVTVYPDCPSPRICIPR
jgi:hypothetical protein